MQYVQPVGGVANASYVDANPVGGIEGSAVPAAAIEHPQREIMAVITGAGMAPSNADLTQLRQAITKMIQAGQRSVIIGGATFAPAVIGTGKAVYWDSANSRFDLALADGSAKQSCVGFADVANGNVYAFGDAVLFAGLTPGARYYLDGSTAGAVTTSAPASNSVFVGIARNATEIFVDIDAQPATTVAAIQGAYKNLKIDALGISNYNCVITVDEVVLENSANAFMTVRAVNKTINAAGAVGAPLSIMSARAASTWYYRWIWYNAAQGLTATLDPSSTAPTPPTGYAAGDYKALLPGACRTDSSGSSYLLQTVTRGRRSQYVVLAGSNVTAYPAIASGVGGTYSQTTPTYVAASVANFVPSTAGAISITLLGRYGNLTSGECNAAPNSSFGGSSSFNPPPMHIDGTTTGILTSAVMVLEGINIYYSAQSAGCALLCNGWEDNL